MKLVRWEFRVNQGFDFHVELNFGTNWFAESRNRIKGEKQSISGHIECRNSPDQGSVAWGGSEIAEVSSKKGQSTTYDFGFLGKFHEKVQLLFDNYCRDWELSQLYNVDGYRDEMEKYVGLFVVVV